MGGTNGAWERPQEQLGGSYKGTVTISALHAVSAPTATAAQKAAMAEDGGGHPQSCVPHEDMGLVVSPLPPVAEERLWLSALALGDVPRSAPGHICPSVSARLSISGVGLLLQPRHLQERKKVGTESCWGLPNSWRLPGGTQAGRRPLPLPCCRNS